MLRLAAAAARRLHTTAAAAAAVKESTGVVGLPVLEDGRGALIAAARRALDLLEAHNIPKDAQYRKSVEGFAHHYLKVCKESEDVNEIENRIGLGQIEEVVRSVEGEHGLIPKMAEWKPWEVPEGREIELIVNEEEYYAKHPNA
eukprot:jgi/Chlat1/2635/Chrsp178S02472